VITFLLALIANLFRLGPSVSEKSSFLRALLNRGTLILYFLFLVTSTYSILTAQRFSLWFYLYALLIGSIVYTMALPKTHQRPAMSFCAVSVPVIVLAVSLAISGPMPITQDEGRFTGFAFRIIEDGNWVSYRYPENIHYQFFHIVPFLKATVFMITGLDMLSVTHPLLVLSLTLLTALGVLMLARISINKDVRFLSLVTLAPILFLSTPPVSTIAFIPHTLSIALYLISFSIVIKALYQENLDRRNLTIVILISVVGVITHAIYPLLFLISVGMLLLAGKLLGYSHPPKLLGSAFKIVIVATIIYWTFSLLLEQVVTTGRSLTTSLVDLFFGEVQPFKSTRPMWYQQAPPELALSWVLFPALTGAFILLKLVKIRGRGISSIREPGVFMGLTGLLILIVGLTSRMAPYSYHRLFYSGYPLLIIPSILAIKGTVSKRKQFNVLMITFIIVAASFYAVQDPAVSPDIHKVMMLANKRSWAVAESLVQHASQNLKYRVDARVEIGFEALIAKSIPTEIFSSTVKSDELLVMNYDNLGKLWASRWYEEATLQAIENGEYDIVFSDGSYKAYYIRR